MLLSSWMKNELNEIFFLYLYVLQKSIHHEASSSSMLRRRLGKERNLKKLVDCPDLVACSFSATSCREKYDMINVESHFEAQCTLMFC